MPNVNPGPATTGANNNAQGGNWYLNGYLFESAGDNITAFPGGGQTNATPLVVELNRITTVATAGDSVKLPTSAAGLTIFIVNHTNNSVQVFGAGTDRIDDVATATGVNQMPNSTVLYFCATAGDWYTEGLAGGFARGYALQTFSSATVAGNTTVTQAAGTPIVTMLVNVTGGAATAVVLPTSANGMEITVHNISAFNVSVFPAAGGTETINALSPNAAIVMATNTSTVFTCVVPGQWYTIPRVPS
jgi:hypothetical protein